jgi:hypothetical protein
MGTPETMLEPDFTLGRCAARRALSVFALATALLCCSATGANAEPPKIVSLAVEGVSATSVKFNGTINPNGPATTFFRFEYLTEAAYRANRMALPENEWFTGAKWAAPSGEGLVGTGTIPIQLIPQEVRGLTPETAYEVRLRAENMSGVVFVTRPFGTQPATNALALLDHRQWEMVSPLDKEGGAVQPSGTISGGGVFQASAGGGSFTFSSADPFGTGVQGVPPGSQYIATRGLGGWTTANISTPLLSGSYGSEPNGVPYQLFSGDLAFGLLSNGERCRGQVTGECPVFNPPLPGSDAPAGYRDYYLRTASGAYESLLSAGDLLHTTLGPGKFELRLVAATPDLAHIVLSSCAALTADATEVPGPEGCDPADQNLYEWSDGGLSLVNLLPGEVVGTPGADVAAPGGAISSDGSRVYFTLGGSVYLREGGTTKPVTGVGGEFAGASTDGSIAYLIDSGQLIRYTAATGILTPLTAGSGVQGVLGISSGGSKVYYAESGAVFLRDGAGVTEVASSALSSDWPAATGTARVTSDGSYLLFLSAAELTGYPNEGRTEVFLYGPPPGGGPASLVCVSCNPSGESPEGSARIPGSRPNGSETNASGAYSLHSLLSGLYSVGFWGQGRNAEYESTYYEGKSSLAQATPVTVTEGHATNGVDAELAKGGQIVGMVFTAAGGMPLSDIAVCLFSDGSRPPTLFRQRGRRQLCLPRAPQRLLSGRLLAGCLGNHGR